MIPADVASRLRLITQDQPAPTQPLIPSKALTDVLSNLVPGQRLIAEIQMLLPNGTYRAMVAQREVTLALPFSAQAGDALELEVIDTDGQVSLAFVAKQTPAGEQAKADSVPTRLSPTGQLIGNLLSDIDAEGKRASPAPLNNNRPLVDKMPESPAALVPILKEALSKSGLFFESHQARWVQGQVDTATLLEHPQGKLSPRLAQESTTLPHQTQPTPLHKDAATTSAEAREQLAAQQAAEKTAAPTAARQGAVAPELMPIVQQQLDALSTQSYLWQGQIWPGQQMQWEIVEEDGGQREGEDEEKQQWTTRLQLTLPNLGGISATLRLRSASDIEIQLAADSPAQSALRAAGEDLRQQLAAAGLKLNLLDIGDGSAE